MTFLSKMLLALSQRLTNMYYDGPEPPKRLDDAVVHFANDHPHATRMEWIEYAQAHANEAYRSGYTRGFEYCERDKDEIKRLKSIDPDKIVAAINPQWSVAVRPNVIGDVEAQPDDWELREAEEIRALFNEISKK